MKVWNYMKGEEEGCSNIVYFLLNFSIKDRTCFFLLIICNNLYYFIMKQFKKCLFFYIGSLDMGKNFKKKGKVAKSEDGGNNRLEGFSFEKGHLQNRQRLMSRWKYQFLYNH